MASERTIPNQDYLGRCYDIVTLDPLNLAISAKYKNALDVQAADNKIVDTRDGKWSIPVWAEHKGIFAFDWEATTGTISSSYEFRDEFKRSVKADAGVDGMFEFSASASTSAITSGTETRKQTFVFARAFRATHGLEAKLGHASLELTDYFRADVEALPVDGFPVVRAAYEKFIETYGTHFTTEIVLGGLAFQRTRGSSSRYLSSQEKQSELQSQGKLTIDALKGGASVEEATKKTATIDKQNELERTDVSFRGGMGDPKAIDTSWIASLDDKPVPIQASLEKLSSLLTERFFPQDSAIGEKRVLLDLATRGWIVAKGEPACDKRPLQYGEPLVLCMRTNDGTQILPGWLEAVGGTIFWTGPASWPLPMATVMLERADDRHDKGTVLAGDHVRLKVRGTSYYVVGVLQYKQLVDTATEATVLTILPHGDDPEKPSRVGQYFLESDDLEIVHKARSGETRVLRVPWPQIGEEGLYTIQSIEYGPHLLTQPITAPQLRFTLRRPGAEPES